MPECVGREWRFAVTPKSTNPMARSNPVDVFVAVTKRNLGDLQHVLRSDPAVVHSRDDQGMPPLYIAALYRNRPAIELLLEHGAELDIFACCYLERNEDGGRLLANDAALVHATTPDGRTPLHYAAQKGNTDFARTLLQHGADVNAREANGSTPLTEAAHGGPWKPGPDKDLIKLFIASGADVDAHIAAAIGAVDMLSKALEIAPGEIDHYDQSGYTPLYYAAHNSQFDCVELLIAKGADVNKACDDGQTPLSTAALHLLSGQGDPEICRHLMAHGAPYDIHTAAALGDVEQIGELLAEDCTQVNLLRYGFFPADYAVHCGQAAALRALLDGGANPRSTDREGRSLLSKCEHLPEVRRVLKEYCDPDSI